jgi:hypothetical protein
MEQMLEKKLTGIIFGIKQGTKTLTDATPILKRLRSVNSLLAEDYDKKLIAVAAARK